MTWIPAIDMVSVEVRARRDGRYGAADPLRWPQIYDPQYAYLCVLPDHFEQLSDHLDLPISTATDVAEDYYEHVDKVDNLGTPLVRLHPDRYSKLSADISMLKSRVWEFIQDDTATHANTAVGRLGPENIHAPLRNYVLSATEAVERMRSLPMTIKQFTWETREYQRYYVEAVAYTEFVTVYTERMLCRRAEAVDSRLIGAVSGDPVVVSRLYSAGIPVWFIRPWFHLLPDLKINDLVEPTLPGDRGVVTEDYDPPFATQYSGPPGIAHLVALHAFGMDVYQRGVADRPPIVPHSGDDNDGQRRPLSPDPLGDQDSAHTPPKPNAGRDHFVDPEHHLIPPSITQWAKALFRVDNDLARIRRDRLPGGYYCPNPATFAIANSLPRFLETWLTIRPAWLLYAADAVYANTPMPNLSKHVWNALLVMSDDQRRHAALQTTPPPGCNASTKARSEAMKLFGRFFPSSDFATPSTVKWFDIQVTTPIRKPDDNLVRKVVWELYELSFRLELSALDYKMRDMQSKPAPLRASRRSQLSSCFPDRRLVITHYPLANVGLAALHPHSLAVYVEALRRIMTTWPDTNSLQIPVRPEDTPQLILDVEHTVVSFYCQRFFDVCGRAAVIPHRLPAH
ncbi:hypothetical protein EVJ58_g7921 [Rhodofomes roseus]|uniref:Uncharacterized protein n=1 Tax=Rhodofomes roseus TaxID=34475 RepID=A0A4Y9Y0K6_9APHY|nr:hypothetical protein EVJ58_g7921 [Rhodofomes roseus]